MSGTLWLILLNKRLMYQLCLFINMPVVCVFSLFLRLTDPVGKSSRVVGVLCTAGIPLTDLFSSAVIRNGDGKTLICLQLTK